jgi:hypothetical protein
LLKKKKVKKRWTKELHQFGRCIAFNFCEVIRMDRKIIADFKVAPAT